MGGVFDLSLGAVGVADELPVTSHTVGVPRLIQEDPSIPSGLARKEQALCSWLAIASCGSKASHQSGFERMTDLWNFGEV